MINRFILNEVSYFGPGAREVLPQEIERLGLHKAFVSTDKDLIKFGVADKVLKVLEQAGIPYVVFSDIKPNPTVANVKAGVKAFAESGADFILAIGGGSSIDTSKAIGIITNNPEFSDVVSLEGVAPTKKKSVPIIALPTTAGTAAEVTINYVITDEANEKKMVCVDPNDIPRHCHRGCRADVHASQEPHRRNRTRRADACHRRPHHKGRVGNERHV